MNTDTNSSMILQEKRFHRRSQVLIFLSEILHGFLSEFSRPVLDLPVNPP